MVKKYRVGLAEEEQEELKAFVSRGRAAAYKQTHARILLLSDENHAGGPMKDPDIAWALKVGTATPWSGCAAAAWSRAWRPLLDESSNSTASGKSWTVRARPT